MSINMNIIKAIARRDLRMYFSNPSGYVFITLFIFLSAAAAFWQDEFFLRNLANLDQLNRVFPLLLLFFVPALTMSVWAEERKQGTDELLLTLPAKDEEVVLGKYLASLGIYSASVLLSLSHVIVLSFLGSPDLGLMISNYLGFWLAGAAFIAVGMLASMLTPNSTIAFILGALLCFSFFFIDILAGAISRPLGDFFSPLGVFNYFGDFASGVISLSGLLYFLSVAGLMLYFNVLLISKRHWPREADGYPMWLHHLVRSVALLVALLGLNSLVGHLPLPLRIDATSEQLHSLTSKSKSLLSDLDDDRPVFIQAYISPDVPRQYVQTRANLIGMLREFDSIGGGGVQVAVYDTEQFSEEARAAREKFGIVPRRIPDLSSARSSISDVFMGLAFTCGANEQVIPFFDRGLPAEYELVRSIRSVAQTDRKRLGVVNSAVQLFGGLDFQTFRQRQPWPVLNELKKQYEVVQIDPANPIEQNLDGLLVMLPSSLSEPEMQNVLAYVEQDNPAMFLVDPLPAVDINNSPSEQPGAGRNPFMQNQQAPPKQKGDIRRFLGSLGVMWDSAKIVWDSYNPHPDLAQLPPEVVFVGRGADNPASFNEDHPASSRLQEIVLIYPGGIQAAPGKQNELEFTPLLRSGHRSGSVNYFQLVQRSFFGVQLNRNLRYFPDGSDYILAAHIKSKGAASSEEEDEAAADGESSTNGAQSQDGQGGEAREVEYDAPKINAIVVTDIDFISEQFFQIRAQGPENLNFDNVSFFFNCMDLLMGDESFIDLRKRRVRHRTLAAVESRTQSFQQRRLEDEQSAEEEADKELADAQSRLDQKVNEVRQDPSLDARAKEIAARNIQEAENRRFEVLKANIESAKESKIQSSRERMESAIRSIQSGIRTAAVIIPPIPVFLLGVLIFIRRQRREREGETAERLLRE